MTKGKLRQFTMRICRGYFHYCTIKTKKKSLKVKNRLRKKLRKLRG